MQKKKAKFVLIIGDEGGILTYQQGDEVLRRMFAPTASYQDTAGFLECLAQDPKAPIYLLVDMMDQSYIQQSLPPVSSFSIDKLIKRRMERDFAAEDLKGALLIGREAQGRRDWKYLFVTLSHSPQLSGWVDMALELPNPFGGLYLLPVEAGIFMQQLHEAVTGEKTQVKLKKGEIEPNRWLVLVAHNKVGGFRQIVLRNNKLIFARLAQPIGDSQPEVIAGSIEQEISVTIEYLKRLGYSDDQAMHLYVIAGQAIKQSIEPRNLQTGTLHLLTPHEVAEAIQYTKATEPTDNFADVILSVAFAKARKHLLRLDTPLSARVAKLYQTILAVRMGAALAGAAACISLVYLIIQIPLTKGKIADLEIESRKANQQLTEIMDLEKGLPDDLEKITDLVSIHKSLNNLGVTPLQTFASLQTIMSSANMLLKEVKWESDLHFAAPVQGTAEQPVMNSDNQEATAPPETITTTAEWDVFETKEGTKPFLKKVDAITDSIKKAFTGSKVELTSKLPGEQENERKEISLGGQEQDPLLGMSSYALKYSIVQPVNKPQQPVAGGEQ